jgi:hypothetical protein
MELLPETSKTWDELFPEGRTICYEGDDPAAFCEEIRVLFGFDPSADPVWEKAWMNGDPDWPDVFGRTCWFHCPAAHLEGLYGSGAWRVGS